MTVSLTRTKAIEGLQEPRYGVQELMDAFAEALAEAPGAADGGEERGALTPRTLHYYLNISLLPGPHGKGRWARYLQDHLNRLVLIRRLQDAHMPLSVIRETLEALSPEQVVEQLATLPAVPGSEPAAAEAQPAQGKAAAQAGSAADYIAHVLAAQQQAARVVREKRSSPPAGPPARRQQTLPGLEEPQLGSQSWERIELAPGVELHVRHPLPDEVRRDVDRVVDFARRRFKRRSS